MTETTTTKFFDTPAEVPGAPIFEAYAQQVSRKGGAKIYGDWDTVYFTAVDLDEAENLAAVYWAARNRDNCVTREFTEAAQ